MRTLRADALNEKTMSTMEAENKETVSGPAESQPLTSDETFVTLGGVAAIVAMVLLMAGIYTHAGPAGAPSPPDGMEVYLTIINDNPMANILAPMLNATAHLLLLVFFIGLYQLFRDESAIMRLALVAGSVGLLFLVVAMILSFSEVELAAQYVGAGSATQSGIAAMAETELRIQSFVELMGNLLAWGVGGLIFSLAILRTSILSRWLGYAGVVYAAVFWVTAVEVAAIPGLTARDSIIYFLGSLFGILWIIAMGVALVRLDESTIS